MKLPRHAIREKHILHRIRQRRITTIWSSEAGSERDEARCVWTPSFRRWSRRTGHFGSSSSVSMRLDFVEELRMLVTVEAHRGAYWQWAARPWAAALDREDVFMYSRGWSASR
jgi:hypothetical protein